MNTKYLDEHLDSLKEKTGVQAYNCKIMCDHELIYQRHGGFSDKETKREMTTDSLVNLYSCSKVITCCAAMQLAEHGKIMLHDPVSKYIAEFADVKVKEKQGDKLILRDPKREMRIYDLFSMTSGINYDLSSPSIRELRERTNGACPTVDIARAIAKEGLEFDPGERFMYGLSHDVLGALIEVVSDMPFGDYLKKNIFDPVGMTDTGFSVPEGKMHRMADQYFKQDGKDAERIEKTQCIYRLGTKHQSGGAGIISCTDDYILFADALANGGVAKTGERILSKAAIDTMRTSRLTAENEWSFHHSSYGMGYGLGVRTCVSRTGGTLIPLGAFGWDGAAGSFTLIDPDNRLAIFYCQHMRGNAGNDYKDVRTANIVYAYLLD